MTNDCLSSNEINSDLKKSMKCINRNAIRHKLITVIGFCVVKKENYKTLERFDEIGIHRDQQKTTYTVGSKLTSVDTIS